MEKKTFFFRKKIYNVMLLGGIFLFSSTTIFAQNNVDYSSLEEYTLYKPVIGDAYSFDNDLKFVLYDIDQDGTRELITSAGNNIAEWETCIYTLEDGLISMIGSFDKNVLLYIAPDSNGLYTVWGFQGREEVSRLTKTGDTISLELVQSRELAADEEFYSNEKPVEWQYFSEVVETSPGLSSNGNNLYSGEPRYEEDESLIEDSYTLENLQEKMKLIGMIIEKYDIDQDFLNSLGLEKTIGHDIDTSLQFDVERKEELFGTPYYEFTTNVFSELTYIGEMENNLPNGHGMLFWYDGNSMENLLVYKGFFKDGRFDDTGVYLGEEDYTDDIEMYFGEYENGIYNGNGILIEIPSTYGGVRFTVTYGEFKDGKLDGNGKVYLNNSLMFEGEFKEGMPDGYAVQYDTEGNIIYEGQWKEGNPN